MNKRVIGECLGNIEQCYAIYISIFGMFIRLI